MNNGTQDGFGKPSAIQTISSKLAILGRWLGIGTSNAEAPLHIQVGADSSNNDPTSPQYGTIFEWFEGRRNLGIGEGIKLSWRVKLITDKKGVEVANIQSYKTTSGDASRLSSLQVNVSPDGILAPTTAFEFTSTQMKAMDFSSIAVPQWASMTTPTLGFFMDEANGHVGLAQNNVKAFYIDSNGNSVSGAGGIGYATGAGGSVTQTTSKSNPVTLNKPCGQITTHAASLAAEAWVEFTVNCGLFDTYDTVVLNMLGSTASKYIFKVSDSGAQYFKIAIKNDTAGALAEALTLRFAILKASVF